MNLNTQKLIIQNLISSSDIFSRCIGILKAEYFEPELRPVMKFITSYFEKYNKIPNIDFVNSQHETEFKARKIPSDEVDFTCNEIESFCQQTALYNAILTSAPDVAAGDKAKFGGVLKKIQEALNVSLQRDMGIEMYLNTEEYLKKLLESQMYESTLIKALDIALGGGFVRKQLTMFSANSGGGKSLMLSNLGFNFSRQGYNVVQISLELSEDMIFLRNTSIMTGVSTDDWKENIPKISSIINQHKEAGAGSFIVKRLPNGSTCNDIRSYLKYYEMEYNRKPDVLIVDYLDLMNPVGGTRNIGIYEQDKQKTEELVEILHSYNCIGITASQQNREAIRNATPDQAVVAGGLSKVNTVDNYISIYMSPEMRIKGQMFLYYLKTRSSKAVGTSSDIAFNPDNLIISDSKIGAVSILTSIKNRVKKPSEQPNTEPLELPGIGIIQGDINDLFTDHVAEQIKIMPIDTYENDENGLLVPNQHKQKSYASDSVDDLFKFIEKTL